MSKPRFETKTHKEALEIYNHNKTAVDPTYRNPVYLAKAMIANGLGEFTLDGRTKFTRQDVMEYIRLLESERQRKVTLAKRSEPIYGLSTAYIEYLRGA